MIAQGLEGAFSQADSAGTLGLYSRPPQAAQQVWRCSRTAIGSRRVSEE